MITLIHSDFLYSVRIWSSILNYEYLHLHLHFLSPHSGPGFFDHEYTPPPFSRQLPWQLAVFCFTMMTLIHRSDFPNSVRIWSSFLNYESLHLFSACCFLTQVPRRQRQRERTPDKLWEQYFTTLVHHFQWPDLVSFTCRPSLYFLFIVPLSSRNSLAGSISRFNLSDALRFWYEFLAGPRPTYFCKY